MFEADMELNSKNSKQPILVNNKAINNKNNDLQQPLKISKLRFIKYF